MLKIHKLECLIISWHHQHVHVPSFLYLVLVIDLVLDTYKLLSLYRVFLDPRGKGPMISGLLVSQLVSQLVTRFKENYCKKFFEIWHEGRGLLVGKSDVGGFLSKIRIFPKFGIQSQKSFFFWSSICIYIRYVICLMDV